MAEQTTELTIGQEHESTMAGLGCWEPCAMVSLSMLA